MIELNDVCFSYESKLVLDHFCFRFHPGKFYGIFGANGSGKSTLLKLITGELKCDSGTIFPEYRSTLERAQNLCLMEQLVPESIPLPAGKVAELGRYPWQNTGKEFPVQPVLELLDLMPLRNRLYSKLSGGEKQRVMLARALVQDTPVLLLDEPFSSMDPGNQNYFYRILKGLSSQGKCVIMVTHDVFVSKEYLDEALFLKNGSLFRSGAPAQIFTNELFSEIYSAWRFV